MLPNQRAHRPGRATHGDRIAAVAEAAAWDPVWCAPLLLDTVQAAPHFEKSISKALLRMPGCSPDRDEDVRVTDPRAMRALAHPTRVAILDHLYLHGPATATECAVAVHESPSSCSFHLRTLARWGFIESLPARGRERPWRPIARTIRGPIEANDGHGDPGAPLALVREYARRDDRLLESYLDHQSAFSPEWRRAVDFTSRTVYLTPDELANLAAAFHALLEPYLPERDGNRRADARRVYLSFRAVPAVDPPPDQP